MRLRRLIEGGVIGALLMPPHAASAQPTGQLWANITLDWVRSHQWTLELDFEPKVQVSAPGDDPGWRSLDITSTAEYSPINAIDLLGELLVGETKETDDVDTTVLTARLGARFHLFSRQERVLLKERLPKRRLVIRDLARVELRNLFYSDDSPTQSVVRFRNRLECLYPINRPKLSDADTVYLTADWEWFIPLSDPNERFANRQRIRAGIGFRHSTAWRYVAQYIWERSRDTTSEPFTTSTNIVNFQIKRVW